MNCCCVVCVSVVIETAASLAPPSRTAVEQILGNIPPCTPEMAAGVFTGLMDWARMTVEEIYLAHSVAADRLRGHGRGRAQPAALREEKPHSRARQQVRIRGCSLVVLLLELLVVVVVVLVVEGCKCMRSTC
jgi:hypothetical protein